MLLTPLARDASDLGSIKVEVEVEAMIRYNNVIKYKNSKENKQVIKVSYMYDMYENRERIYNLIIPDMHHNQIIRRTLAEK